MTYRISTSTDSSLFTYIVAAADNWTDLEMCTFVFTRGADTTAWNTNFDGINMVNIDQNFCTHQGNCGQGILGLSGTWSTGVGTEDYHAVESDVLVNGEEFSWGDGTGGTFDTVAVITHELGHSLGLTHPGSVCRDGGSSGCGPEFEYATMYWNYSYPLGIPTNKSSLELDDVASCVYGYPRSVIRVRVMSGSNPVSGATVELIGTAAPVNGSSIETGGMVYGDITSINIGDNAPSSTYVNSTPFSLTDADGYTNYIKPVHKSFQIRVTSGSTVQTKDVTAPDGTSTYTVNLSGSSSDKPSGFLPSIYFLLNQS